MGKSSKKSISRTSNPARRAQRDDATTTETAVTAAPQAAATPSPSTETPAAEAPRHEVAQLAFHYFTESGFVHGNALDHWLRAETELGSGS